MIAGFDMHTLITVLIVGHVISLTLLIVDYTYSRGRKGDVLFISGRICQLFGLVLAGQRGEISLFLSVVVGNFLVMTGQALEAMAWVSLKTKLTRKWYIFCGVSLAAILTCLSDPFSLSRTMRITIPALLQSAFLLVPGLILAIPRARSSPTQTVISALYIVAFLAAIWRYQYILGVKYRLFMTDLPHSFFFVMLIFLLIGGSQGYILIKKEYANHELEQSNRNLQREKEMVAHYEAQLRQHQLERAELRVLQAQIKPHFLQNTLGAIGYFCRVDAEKAQRLILDLGTYLRGTFELTEDYASLEEELKSVRAYLDIEAVRFGPRLEVEYELEGDLSNCRIPPFTLQPLVENAVRHGIAPRRSGGTIRISIRVVDGGFAYMVEDDGVGIPAELIKYLSNSGIEPRQDKQGLGLYSVDRRLRTMYGAGLKIEGAPDQGTRISFFIPKQVNDRLEECPSD